MRHWFLAADLLLFGSHGYALDVQPAGVIATAQIQNGAVDTAKLATDSVTAAKILWDATCTILNKASAGLLSCSSGKIGLGGTPQFLFHAIGANNSTTFAIGASGIAIGHESGLDGTAIWEAPSTGDSYLGHLHDSESTGLHIVNRASHATNKIVTASLVNGRMGVRDTTPTATVDVASDTGHFKFTTLSLGDDQTYAMETNFGNRGMITVVSDDGVYCIYSINASENSASEHADTGGRCTATDTDGSFNIIPDGDSTYTLKNRRGAAIKVSVHFVGFE